LAAPDYSFTVSTESAILRFTAHGAFSAGATKSLFDTAAAEARRGGVDKLLLDVRDVTGALTTGDRYEIGVYAAHRHQALKVAVISLPEMVNYFGELVARNRGWDGRVFVEEGESLAWLRGELADEAIAHTRPARSPR
jgi:hypothetical protein